jgi:hypothetical protein
VPFLRTIPDSTLSAHEDVSRFHQASPSCTLLGASQTTGPEQKIQANPVMQDCDCLTCIFESISRKGLFAFVLFLGFFPVHEYFDGVVFRNGFQK